MEGAFKEHMARIFSVVDAELIRERRFRVAVDCANGVGALCSAGFLEKLGCEVFAVNTAVRRSRCRRTSASWPNW